MRSQGYKSIFLSPIKLYTHRQALMLEQHLSIHQRDALVEVGGFAVDAVDFLQQAAAGEGYQFLLLPLQLVFLAFQQPLSFGSRAFISSISRLSSVFSVS